VVTEPIDVEATEVTHAGMVPAIATAAVEPAVSSAKAVELQQGYYELCRKLLDDSDYQAISGKRFPKKSAWRKLAVAFNVNTELVGEEYVYVGERQRIVTAKMVVRATAPNGRHMDGIGLCDLYERCCPTAFGGECPKATWSRHVCCQADCSGTIHFSNAQHDLPATAMTRATNRACSDLFGMGEVSAEEIGTRGQAEPQYEEINGEQIPVAVSVPTTRSGPGANLEKDRKRIYAICKDRKLDLAVTLGRILGETAPETTFKLDAAQCGKVLAQLNLEK
jgi:hypothetical protein